jgi:hypothetical protein
MKMEQWSESTSIDECRKFTESMKTCPIFLDQDDRINYNWWDPGPQAWTWSTCDGAKASLLVGRIVTNRGDSLARRLVHKMFPFEVSFAPVDIQSQSHAPWGVKSDALATGDPCKCEFRYPLTDDDSWMPCDYTSSRMWTMTQSDVNLIARSINHPRKTMMTVFVGINDIALLNICWKRPN